MTTVATSTEIEKAIAKRYNEPDFFYISQCKNGPSNVITGDLLIFDGLAIAKSWAHPNIIGFEIKVTRGDFKRDNKYGRYMPYCHEFYFVCPTDMIDRSELENDIGLIYYNPKNGVLNVKKKAVHRRIEISSQLLMYVIMNRLGSDRIPFYSTKKDYFEDWLKNKKSNKELAAEVHTKMVSQLKLVEEQERRRKANELDLEVEISVFKKIKELLFKAHIITQFQKDNYVASIPQSLEEHLSKPNQSIDTFQLETLLSEALREVKKIKLKGEL